MVAGLNEIELIAMEHAKSKHGVAVSEKDATSMLKPA